MAITTEINETNFDKVVQQTTASATPDDNIFNGAGNIFYIQAKNSNATAAFLKLYDSTGPTVGTTAPDIQIFCKGNVTQNIICRTGISFATGISMCGVQEDGTEGSTGAESALQVTIIGA